VCPAPEESRVAVSEEGTDGDHHDDRDGASL
jgi:hypothetical protein